jgi:hypothetical protein
MFVAAVAFRGQRRQFPEDALPGAQCLSRRAAVFITPFIPQSESLFSSVARWQFRCRPDCVIKAARVRHAEGILPLKKGSRDRRRFSRDNRPGLYQIDNQKEFG